VEYGTAGQATVDNILRCMRIAYWVTKATNTHPEYVVLIAFLLQKLLRKRASVLGYVYFVCLI
jgi:hypothetical protein